MMVIFRRRNTEDKHVIIRAGTILAAYDTPDGGGCEVNYTTPTGDVLTARVAETAMQVCEMVNSKPDHLDKVKFVVAVPESRLAYSDAINVARTVRDMVRVVEQYE